MPPSDRERHLLEACQRALDYFVRPGARSMHTGVTLPRQLTDALAAYADDELPLPWLREEQDRIARLELIDRR